MLYVFILIFDDIQVFQLTEFQVGNGPHSLSEHGDICEEITSDHHEDQPDDTSDGIAEQRREDLC